MKRCSPPLEETFVDDGSGNLSTVLRDAVERGTKRARLAQGKMITSEAAQLPAWGSERSTATTSDHYLRLLASQNKPSAMSSLLLNRRALLEAELAAMYIQDQRAAAQNAVFVRNSAASRALGSNMSPTVESILASSHPSSMMRALQEGALLGSGSLHPQRQQQQRHASLLRSVADLTMGGYNVPAPAPTDTSDLSVLLRRISEANSQSVLGSNGKFEGMGLAQGRLTAPTSASATRALTTNGVCIKVPRAHGNRSLPPMDDGKVEHYSKRAMCPLGVDEDPNWLSEFHCFVRSELVEVFRASHEDVKTRNNSIAYQQVGVRCRFCAHLTPSARAGRSSAFPSSMRQIYQSFTMMLRDHFGSCDAIPVDTQERFIALKDKPAQGATDSKRYWIYSAMKIGMTDSSAGILVSEHTLAAGATAQPFGTSPNQSWSDDVCKSIPLVLPSDKALVSEFLYVLMSQVQMVRLTEAERIGNRRSLPPGLPGFACRYCCEHRRFGLCRMFPARRRTLPSKVEDVYDHIRRCTVCPDTVKEQLERTRHQMGTGFQSDTGSDRDFFDRIWSRLGHGGKS